MRKLTLLATMFAVFAVTAAHAQKAEKAGNLFGDPFVQVTGAMPGCPVPRGPYITAEQARVQQHVRSQHGGSCFRVGRCRLPNSYLYDAEIVPRVQTYIREDGRFNDTSLWILGERRIVTIFGCVKSREQAIELERTVTLVDDVLNVVPFVMVGADGKPPYRVVGDTTPD
jgi:hypothetical protein